MKFTAQDDIDFDKNKKIIILKYLLSLKKTHKLINQAQIDIELWQKRLQCAKDHQKNDLIPDSEKALKRATYNLLTHQSEAEQIKEIFDTEYKELTSKRSKPSVINTDFLLEIYNATLGYPENEIEHRLDVVIKQNRIKINEKLKKQKKGNT